MTPEERADHLLIVPYNKAEMRCRIIQQIRHAVAEERERIAKRFETEEMGGKSWRLLAAQLVRRWGD